MAWQSLIGTVLLPAILAVESHGNLNIPDGAAGERGPYQIKAEAWHDAAEYIIRHPELKLPVLPAWDTGAHDLEWSRVAATAYLLRYGSAFERAHGTPPTMRDLARIHNGGPTGWKKHSTLAYWKRVQSRLAPRVG